MIRYLGHDLSGGLREEFDDLGDVAGWVEWVESTYPGTSRELILQAFKDGKEVGPSRWAKDVADLLAESASAQTQDGWGVVRTGRWGRESLSRRWSSAGATSASRTGSAGEARSTSTIPPAQLRNGSGAEASA